MRLRLRPAMRRHSDGTYLAGEGIETPTTQTRAGAINLFYGEPGLTAVGANRTQFFSRDSRGMAGAADDFEFLGSTLAVGDFNGDGHDDLAVAATAARLPGVGQSGAVHVLYGALFADDFEVGDPDSWSSVVP